VARRCREGLRASPEQECRTRHTLACTLCAASALFRSIVSFIAFITLAYTYTHDIPWLKPIQVLAAWLDRFVAAAMWRRPCGATASCAAFVQAAPRKPRNEPVVSLYIRSRIVSAARLGFRVWDC
jgi:hypothetical protein